MIHEAEILAFLPFLVLAGTIVFILLVIPFWRNHIATVLLSLAGLAIAAGSVVTSSKDEAVQVTSLFVVDWYGKFFMLLFFIATAFIILISYNYLKERQGAFEEYYLLLLLVTLGASLLVISRHFAGLFLSMELLSVSLYTLIAYLWYGKKPIEAGLKYLILGASSSAILLFGVALLYAEFGTLEFAVLGVKLMDQSGFNPWFMAGLALIFTGIGFKLAIVPFHFWAPEVYRGAPPPVAAFIATISKGAVVSVFWRFFIEIQGYFYLEIISLISIFAVISMFTGNLLALKEKNIKRLLAYSSIAHIGYILVAFVAATEMAMNSILFYLATYFAGVIGAFAVITVLSGKAKDSELIADYQGLFWRRHGVAILMTISMLSLAGIPLTAGFMGKFFLFFASAGRALWLLLIVMVVNSAIGLFYYLRVIVSMFTDAPSIAPDEPEALPSPLTFADRFSLVLIFVIILWLGCYPAAVFSLMN